MRQSDGPRFYLCDPRRLILLQLLLEAVVGADKGADSLDGGQTLLPAVVGDGHKVGHHHGGAAGDSGQAAAGTGQGSGQGLSFRLWGNGQLDRLTSLPTSEPDRLRRSDGSRGWSQCILWNAANCRRNTTRNDKNQKQQILFVKGLR